MFTTEEEFKAILKDNPGDIATRLVYADWLEELSRPEAEVHRTLGQSPYYIRSVCCIPSLC